MKLKSKFEQNMEFWQEIKTIGENNWGAVVHSIEWRNKNVHNQLGP
jgi:hypothetical protein